LTGTSVEQVRAPRPPQTQYVRINNNRFTAEDVEFQGGGGTNQGNFNNNNFNPNFNNNPERINRNNQGTEVIERGAPARGMARRRGCSKMTR
jgi:hypothetical protein